MFVRIIDSNGFFIEDAFYVENSYDNANDTVTLSDGRIISATLVVDVSCPDGFYLPRWDGENWIEGKTAEEISEIKASTVPQPTDTEKLQSQIDYLSMMTGVEIDV